MVPVKSARWRALLEMALKAEDILAHLFYNRITPALSLSSLAGEGAGGGVKLKAVLFTHILLSKSPRVATERLF